MKELRPTTLCDGECHMDTISLAQEETLGRQEIDGNNTNNDLLTTEITF